MSIGNRYNNDSMEGLLQKGWEYWDRLNQIPTRLQVFFIITIT